MSPISGFYCPAGVDTEKCPAGKYGGVTGADSEASGCILCPAGKKKAVW